MKARNTVTLAAAAALVIAGVFLEGTQQNPWNLVMSYLFSVGAIEGLRRLPALAAWLMSTIVVGLAIYGAAWTLGPNHAASAWASLVYVGLAGAVLSSATMPIGRGKDDGESGV